MEVVDLAFPGELMAVLLGIFSFPEDLSDLTFSVRNTGGFSLEIFEFWIDSKDSPRIDSKSLHNESTKLSTSSTFVRD